MAAAARAKEEEQMPLLRERKPNLSEYTYRTYNSSLKRLRKIETLQAILDESDED